MKLTKEILKNLIIEMMEPLGPDLKEKLLWLLNHEDPTFQQQGLDLAEMMVPELMGQVDEMIQDETIQNQFLKLIKVRIQDFVNGAPSHWMRPEAQGEIKSLFADDSPLWTTTKLERTSSDYNGFTMPQIIDAVDFDSYGHDTWVLGSIFSIAADAVEDISGDMSFKIDMDLVFDVMDEVNALFKDQNQVMTSLKSRELIKLIGDVK